jgi:hypothetical protein
VGTEWLLLQRDDGTPLRIPREWTDLRACDPYQDLSSGQGLFRLPDLLSLASLLKVSDQEGARPEGEDVQ